VIAAVVLAAGRATRMGHAAPKVLLPVGERTMLSRVIAAAKASRCGAIVVVAGSHADAVRREAESLGAGVVLNARYRDGMATSLAVGVAALPPEAEAAVVLLGDQPCVSAAAIDRLIAAYRTTGKLMVLSRYGTATGAPALIARPLFPEVQALTGDVGARGLALRHPERVAEIALALEEASDVDTPDDLARVRRALGQDREARGS
jgi:molybdenum cofactor cytidylyltransferase